MIDMTHGDCMEFMAGVEDGFYDLAIVDPEYGIGMDGGNVGYKGFNNFKKKDWDNKRPEKMYFDEFQRISKNQIIWGGNYFADFLPPSRCYIVWDKGEGFKNRTYAEAELAWTSFDKNVKIFKHDPLAKGDYRGKIHPTQKPVKLYEWLLTNYAKPGDKILDTHGGSGSICIACYNLGFDLDWIEKDSDYFEAAKKRYEGHTSQGQMFI